MNEDRRITPSSGNVFADLGFPNPEELQAKADLMILINIEIERLGLTQAQAAKVLGVAQSDVSNLARGRGRTYSFERLAQFLHALGVSVSIVTKKGKKTDTIVLHA